MAEFQFPDVESASNAWRYCILQHSFYRTYEITDGIDQNDKIIQPNIEVSSFNALWCIV